MVKALQKPLITKKTSLNSTPNTLKEYPTPLKSRQEINREYYQRNKEKRNQQGKERYIKKRQKAQQQEKVNLSKYYEAEAIKVLMSLKEYTELNSVKHKFWLDFIWTFKTLNQKGFSDIIQIMKVRETAKNLINDYWTTARSEIKKGKSWNVLTDEEQRRLIRYWSYEKARVENGCLDTAEQLERQSQEYLKEIELTKFHEERGKKGCKCWWCKERSKVQGEIKKKWEKEIDEINGIIKQHAEKMQAREKDKLDSVIKEKAEFFQLEGLTKYLKSSVKECLIKNASLYPTENTLSVDYIKIQIFRIGLENYKIEEGHQNFVIKERVNVKIKIDIWGEAWEEWRAVI